MRDAFGITLRDDVVGPVVCRAIALTRARHAEASSNSPSWACAAAAAPRTWPRRCPSYRGGSSPAPRQPAGAGHESGDSLAIVAGGVMGLAKHVASDGNVRHAAEDFGLSQRRRCQ